MFVDDQRSALPPAGFAEMLGHLRRQFGEYTNALASAPAGAERGRLLHRMMDDAIASAPHVPVSCRSGCYGCCHSEVEITPDEAAVLRERVLAGFEIDRSRLAVQAARERMNPAWAKFWSQENRCVFLSAEGTCRIYEDRPAVCRRFLVTSPPEACTTPGAALAPVRILLVEILLSAAVSMDGATFGSLSKMLTSGLQKEFS
jgi:Fe-S-cluster containining protein